MTMPADPRPTDAALLDRAQWLLGMTVHPDTAQIMPAAMSHVKASDFAGLAMDVIRAFTDRLSAPRDAGEGITRCDMGDHGEFDEIVGRGHFHLERLSDNTIWFRLHDQAGTLFTKGRGPVRVQFDDPPESRRGSPGEPEGGA